MLYTNSLRCQARNKDVKVMIKAGKEENLAKSMEERSDSTMSVKCVSKKFTRVNAP